MNERIQKFAEEAAWKTRMTHNNAHWRMQEKLEDITWREKFAVLIVKECMNATRGASTGLDAFNNIKEHFGVE